MDFERQFWDEQTPITPQELNRIESGIESLYKRPRIYTGELYIEPFELDPNEVQTYIVSCPGAKPWHFALSSHFPDRVTFTFSVQARASNDAVEVRIENISDLRFATEVFGIYVVALDFDDLFGIDPIGGVRPS